MVGRPQDSGVLQAVVRTTLFWQIVAAAVFLSLWQYAGNTTGSQWISQPSLIIARLAVWAGGVELYHHLFVTLAEIVIGLAIAVPLGAVAGLWLGRAKVPAAVLQPAIVALYCIPVIALIPLLILWFGFDMEPKVIAVVKAVAFIVFFNAFTGVQQIDQDVLSSLRLMGSNRREEFRKVIIPATMAWVFTGVKIALPYSFTAAIAGEMLAARHGLGVLVSRAAAQFDLTGVYAALFILMVIGAIVSGVADVIEDRFLRWRHAQT